MINLIWKYNNSVITTPVEMGSYEQLEESQEFEVEIRHDSVYPITDCELYLSPYSGIYKGTSTAIKDFERLIWLGNNYPDYGLSIIQRYTAIGVIDSHNGIRIIDTERFERNDIFADSSIEIISGPAIGETAEIDHYLPDSKLFIMKNDFSSSTEGSNYKIPIVQETFLKTRQGSSYDYTVPLVYKGGVIERLDAASVSVKIRVPKYAVSADTLMFDLNMNFIYREN